MGYHRAGLDHLSRKRGKQVFTVALCVCLSVCVRACVCVNRYVYDVIQCDMTLCMHACICICVYVCGGDLFVCVHAL